MGFNLRMPTDLHTAVADAASQDGRSINSWVVRAIMDQLARQTPPDGALAKRILRLGRRQVRTSVATQ